MSSIKFINFWSDNEKIEISLIFSHKSLMILHCLLHYSFYPQAPSRKFLAPTLSDGPSRSGKENPAMGLKKRNPRLQASEWEK